MPSHHIDIVQVQTAEGGIDRTSKFAVTQLVSKADRKTAGELLRYMLAVVPYQVLDEADLASGEPEPARSFRPEPWATVHLDPVPVIIGRGSDRKVMTSSKQLEGSS